MKIIYLCGNKKYQKEFKEVEKEELLKGNIVIKSFSEDEEQDKEILKKDPLTNLKKIQKVDEIYVINVNEDIDEDSVFEINYAKDIKKEIKYLYNKIENQKEEIIIKEDNTILDIKMPKTSNESKERLDIQAVKIQKTENIEEEQKEEQIINIFQKKETNYKKTLIKIIITIGILFLGYKWIIDWNGKEVIFNGLNKLVEEKQVKNPNLNTSNSVKEKSKLENILLVLNYNKSILEKQENKKKELENKINMEKTSLSNLNISQIDLLKTTPEGLKKYLIEVNKEIEEIMISQLNDESKLNNYTENNLKVIFEKYKK